LVKERKLPKQVMGQRSFFLENMHVLNETEVLVENSISDKPVLSAAGS